MLHPKRKQNVVKIDCKRIPAHQVDMSHCETCGKEFTTEGLLKRHREKKTPCRRPERLLHQVLENKIEEIIGSQHMLEPSEEFRENSQKLNKTLSRDVRAEEGIFFTPKKVRTLLFETLRKLGVVEPNTILEPSFGSGEFLLDARRLYPKANLVGVEKNTEIFNTVKCSGATLCNADFLDWTGRADLIIGNPPYFVVPPAKDKKEFQMKWSTCMTGRPNIYVMFLYKCLHEHLNDNGYLAFILPTSIYNSSYYQPMRDYIQMNTTIRHVETLNKAGFYETGQETTLLILQKGKYNDDFLYKTKNNTFSISPDSNALYELVKNTKTLKDFNLRAKTGNIVWNQMKDELADYGTLLIYSSNISNSDLIVGNLKGDGKKQYVRAECKKEKLKGPMIVVERGYGNSFQFNPVLISQDEFYAENHVNVIYPLSESPETLANLKTVLKSLQDPRTKQFMEMYVGNGAVSATDLQTIVPIFYKD
jgi:adenine-specific DNA-methyltransferase